MLMQAEQAHPKARAEGRPKLFQGRAEALPAMHFPAGAFDWIYAITGAFSYVDDAEFRREHLKLYKLLKPGGRLLTAHLTPFCLSERLYHLCRGHPRAAMRRWPGQISIRVGWRPQQMHLRPYSQLRLLFRRWPCYLAVQVALCWQKPLFGG